MNRKKQKEERFEKIKEWRDFDASRRETIVYSFLAIIMFFCIGLFFGWLILPCWIGGKIIENYKENNFIYWRKIK